MDWQLSANVMFRYSFISRIFKYFGQNSSLNLTTVQCPYESHILQNAFYVYVLYCIKVASR